MARIYFRLSFILLAFTCQLTFLLIITERWFESGVIPHIDFAVFWGAAKLALNGDAMAAFDWRTLEAAQGIEPNDAPYFWFYPPSLHLLVAPLGALPFPVAYGLFTLGGLAAFSWATLAWTEKYAWIAIASPVTIFALFVGNISILWCTALLVAFRLQDRPVISGAFIAAMTMKPQLGILVPVALLASGSWRLIFWSTLWTLILLGIATAVFGLAYWTEFFESLSSLSAAAADHRIGTNLMMSWYGFMGELDFPHGAALGFQAFAALGAAASVVIVWRRSDVDLRIATLCLAILLATPYALKYEAVLAAVAAMFLLRDGSGRTRSGLLVVALLLLAPTASWIAGFGLTTALSMAPTMTVGLVWCIGQSLTRQPAKAAKARLTLSPAPTPDVR